MLRLAIAVALTGALLLTAMAPSPEWARPVRVVTLEGDTFHVQGLLAQEDLAYVTSVDRATKRGLLFTFSLASGKRLSEVAVQRGDMYHPGGFDADADFLYVPVAQYRAKSASVIQKRSRADLSLVSSFPVPDHIGAVAVAPDRLYLANWDARKIYEYSHDGRLLQTRNNPTSWRYQDMKWRAGSLVASALAPKPRTDHRVVWLDPQTLFPLREAHAGVTDRGVSFVHEGLDTRDGKLYVLPEDAPSRLFVFDLLSLAADRALDAMGKVRVSV